MTPTSNVSDRSVLPPDASPRTRELEGDAGEDVEGRGDRTFGKLLSSLQSQRNKTGTAAGSDDLAQTQQPAALDDIDRLLIAALTVQDAAASDKIDVDAPVLQQGDPATSLAACSPVPTHAIEAPLAFGPPLGAKNDVSHAETSAPSSMPPGPVSMRQEGPLGPDTALPAVAVTRKEAHFEAISPTPFQQIVERIAAELGGGDSDKPMSAVGVPASDARQEKSAHMDAPDEGALETDNQPRLIVEARRGQDPHGSASRDALPRGDQALPADKPAQKIGSGHEQKVFEAAAPAMPPELATDGVSAPIKQIANGIAAAPAAAPSSAPAQVGPGAGLARALPGGGVMKVLHIQLQPAELGLVTVRMSLKDDVLDLQIEAGRHATAQLLQKDPEVLTGLLRSAGYHVDGVSVRVVGPDGASASTGTGQSLVDVSAQSNAGSAQSDARSSREHQRAQSDTNPSDTNRSANEDQSISHRRSGDGLYV